jgi:hypothetical protein
MDTVTIISKEDISLDGLRPVLARYWNLVEGGPGRVVIEEINGRVYIYHPKLDSGEIASNHLYLDYSSVDLVKRVVQVIADDPEVTVENDFGTALPGDQFVARLKSDRSWDWRL